MILSARRARTSGFTLVEILIATSIVAVLGLAIAETLRAAREADRRLQTRAERRAQDRAILRRISDDLRALMPPGGTYAAGLVGEQNLRAGGRELLSLPEEEAAADLRAANLQCPSPPYGERDRITISVIPGARRFGSVCPLGAGSIQSIVWEVDDDPLTLERGLVRRPTTIRDPVPGAPPESCEVVCDCVCGLAFRYFDGTDWQQTWDSGAQDLLPQAIEVSVAVRDPDGTIRLLMTVVAPQTGRPAVQIQATQSP